MDSLSPLKMLLHLLHQLFCAEPGPCAVMFLLQDVQVVLGLPVFSCLVMCLGWSLSSLHLLHNVCKVPELAAFNKW